MKLIRIGGNKLSQAAFQCGAAAMLSIKKTAVPVSALVLLLGLCSAPAQAQVNITVDKDNLTNTLVAGATTVYRITARNIGTTGNASGSVLRDPAVAGLMCTNVVCSGVTGSATCPAVGGVTIGNLQGSGGIFLSNFPAVSSISFDVTCGVTATGT